MNIPLISLSIFLWLPFAAAQVSLVDNELVSELSLLSATDAQLANISFRLYTGNTTNEYRIALVNDAPDLIAYMDLGKPTVFYIFGWTESPNSLSVLTVIGAYLQRHDHNVIVADWQEIAAGSYLFAALSASRVGLTMAEGLDKLVASGLNASCLHVVSHSLGSQVAGFIGRNVNFTLPRITGLDPAGPGFYFLIEELTSADALFVDVIHTDAGVYGTAENDGTVNFYPNGGTRVQPGCPLIRIPASTDDFCDHHRSWYYYAESLLNEIAFVGRKCSSNLLFELRFCGSIQRAPMGYATPTTVRGNYYLQTNSASPFGRGIAGSTFSV